MTQRTSPVKLRTTPTFLIAGLCAGVVFAWPVLGQSQSQEQSKDQAKDQAKAQAKSASQTTSLQKQVEQAYAQTDQYLSHVKYKAVQNDSRWKRTRQTDMTIAFNRPKRMLSVDRPSVMVNSNGQSLRLNFKQIEDKYLKQELSGKPLKFSMLTDTLPALSRPAFPDLLLLISDSPWAAMVGQAGQSKAMGSDQQAGGDSKVKIEQIDSANGKDPTLRVTGKTGVMTLHINPQTHLVGKARFKVNAQEAGMGKGQSA